MADDQNNVLTSFAGKTSIQQQIQTTYQRLQELQRQSLDADQIDPSDLTQSIQEFSSSLEEIWVSLEEWVQNQTSTDQERHYAELFESAPDAYVVTDRYGAITMANRSAATLLNCPKQYLCRKPLVMFVPEADRPEFRHHLAQLNPNIPTGEWQCWLQPHYKQDPLPVAITLAILPTPEGTIDEIRWSIRDLSQQTRADLPERALAIEQEFKQMRSQFIQTVSHEFRTPLSVIKTAIDLLERGYRDQVSEKHQKLFDLAKGSIATLTQMIDDVLIFSRAEVGKLQVTPHQIQLQPFCQQLIDTHQVNLGCHRQIQFSFQGQPGSIFTDEKLLRQILSNLITNALKYSSSHTSIQVNVSFHPQATPYPLRIQVTDQGIGIPLEEQGRLFEAFHRCANVDQIPGTGLGLAIVKRAILLLGGQIWVDSQPGQGSTFTVVLPLLSTQADTPRDLDPIAFDLPHPADDRGTSADQS